FRVHELTRIAGGVPWAPGVIKLAANPVALTDGINVTESNGHVVQYNWMNGKQTGGPVIIPGSGNTSSSVSSATVGDAFTAFSTGADDKGNHYLYEINSADTAIVGRIPVAGRGFVASDKLTNTLVYAAVTSTGSAVQVIPLVATGHFTGPASATFTTGKPGRV